jgi:hypothetical protein
MIRATRTSEVSADQGGASRTDAGRREPDSTNQQNEREPDNAGGN